MIPFLQKGAQDSRSLLRRLVLADRLAEQHALRALATSQQLGLRRYTSRHFWSRSWELRANLLTADARPARTPDLRCSLEILEQ